MPSPSISSGVVSCLARNALGRKPGWWLAQLALLALAAYVLSDVVRCLGTCYVDVEAIHGSNSILELVDMRLNSWILAWVQHAVLVQPGALFDGNVFHPADGALTGSEHMLGVSLPLLPLRVFHPGAIALHQAGTVLSFLILAWTTFALVHWLTRSIWAAFVAAATTMFMPWRIAELGHLQLLSAHWVPLIWLLIGKIALGEAQRSSARLLALVTLLQLLSSYYLAYFTTASIAVLVVVLTLRHGIRRETVLPWAVALALTYAVFALISVPYLLREVASDLVLPFRPGLSSDAFRTLASLAPRFVLSASELPLASHYTPLCVALLALLGVLLAPFAGRADAADVARLRSYSIALWSVVVVAFILSFGHRTTFGEGAYWPLPGGWAAEWVPGFRYLRAPLRWASLIGIAGPVLAGIGVSLGERALGRWRSGSVAAGLRWGLRAAVLAFVASNMPWKPFPVFVAVPDEPCLQAYARLRALPPGPVLEIPWPIGLLQEVDANSSYMLASTWHWKPILNGFTAYRPRTYDYLYRIGWTLPSADGLQKLSRLTGLRWIVVHREHFDPRLQSRWQRLVDVGTLRSVYDNTHTWILELVDRDDSGAWLDALKSTAPRAHTFTGLSREPLQIPTGAGRLGVTVPEVLPARAKGRGRPKAEVRIWNGTRRPWPGFDIQTEGLVELRYRFVAGNESIAHEGTIPLYADVPSRRTLIGQYYLTTPETAGAFRLRFDLVQRVAGSLIELPVPSVESGVTVRSRPTKAPAG